MTILGPLPLWQRVPEVLSEPMISSEIGQVEYAQMIGEMFCRFAENTLSGNFADDLQNLKNQAQEVLQPSIDAFLLENNYYYSGPNQIGPNWTPDVCPTVWEGDRGLCEEHGSPWGIFAQRYVSGFEPEEDSEVLKNRKK